MLGWWGRSCGVEGSGGALSGSRTFIPSIYYMEGGWWAVVTVEGYWRGPRFTRLGAELAADRMARKFNRLEAQGVLR